MKKTLKLSTNKLSSKKRTGKKQKATVTIDTRLNALSSKILFPKKLEKANRFLAKHGIPA